MLWVANEPIMLSVIILSAIILSVIMLSVVKFYVVAPIQYLLMSPNLELKTNPKQFLGSLLLVIML